MNYFLGSYIDLIQTIGFISICTFILFVFIRLILDNKKDNCIESVTIRLDD